MIYLQILLLLVLALAVAMVPKNNKFFIPKNIVKISPRKKTLPLNLPTLAGFSKDLTLMASRGELDPVVGRDKEIMTVIQILSRRTKNNPILIGKSGVGKTAVVEGLAQTLLANIWQEGLVNKRVLSLDLSNLLAGTKFRGEFEKRLQNISSEIIAAKRQIILFIDEIHTLANAGESTGGISAADILKPALARGDLQMIGATTTLEYNANIKQDKTLSRRFQPVLIKEPSQKEAVGILLALKPRYSKYHQVEITDGAIRQAVVQSVKYIKDRCLPDKAIDLMDEAASMVKLRNIIMPAKDGVLSKVVAKDIDEVIKNKNNS